MKKTHLYKIVRFNLRRFKRLPGPLQFGMMISFIWIALSASYVIGDWREVKNLAPNNVGDLAAGVCAPLAFLWLVVATFLQKDELGLQRVELRESRLAQQKQANESEQLVEQSRVSAQAAIAALEKQGARDDEERHHRSLNRLADSLRLKPERFSTRSNTTNNHIFGDHFQDTSPDAVLMSAAENLKSQLRNTLTSGVKIHSKDTFLRYLRQLTTTVRLAMERGEDQTAFGDRVRMLDLEGFLADLDQAEKVANAAPEFNPP